MAGKIEDLDAINHPLTEASVIEFHSTFGDERLNGYDMANSHYTEELKNILEKTSSYLELKQELTVFLKGREAFSNYIDLRFDYDTGIYHIQPL